MRSGAGAGSFERDDLVATALGERPADLVVRGGRLVNVYSGEIYRADVAVTGDRIAAVGDLPHAVGEQTVVVEAEGRYLVPGFIDCHIHVGASSLTMTELARLLVAHGTAAIVTDFTEAGKMRGKAAMRFFLDETARTPLTAYFSPFYTTLAGIEGRPGATLEELEEMLDWPEARELREWNVYAQRHPNETLRGLADIARKHGRLLCGHMEGQRGATLQASVAAGASSDHEAATVEEAVERLRLGLALQIRFSSGADNMRECLRAVVERRLDTSNVMFSTDEEDLDELATLGHIDHRVRVAVELGVPPVEAVRMASLNAARYLGVSGDLGGIAPGRKAFINLVDDLRNFRVTEVVAGATAVARDGRFLHPLEAPEYPQNFQDSVSVGKRLEASDLRIEAGGDGEVEVLVIGVRPYEVETRTLFHSVRPSGGQIAPDPGRDLAKIAVVERHTPQLKIGLGFIEGFGLQRGAFGSSYHPGPVQIGVVGTNDEDMAVVVNRIAELQGGFVVVDGGEVIAEVPLPLLGFLSAEPADEVAAAFVRGKRVLKESLGCDFGGLFTALAYVCMPGVLPTLRISTGGLISVRRSERRLDVASVELLRERVS